MRVGDPRLALAVEGATAGFHRMIGKLFTDNTAAHGFTRSGRLPSMHDGDLPRRVEKPWGSELWFAQTDRYAGKLLQVRAGQRLSLQYHERKDETSFVLSGRLLLRQGPNADTLIDTELATGSAWRNEPGQVHTIEALEDAVIVEVSTPELDDVVRLSDDYGRTTGILEP